VVVSESQSIEMLLDTENPNFHTRLCLTVSPTFHQSMCTFLFQWPDCAKIHPTYPPTLSSRRQTKQ